MTISNDTTIGEKGTIVFDVTETVDFARVKQYSEVALDKNPIHTDPAIAKQAGLPGPIAHGMLIVGITLAQLRNHLPAGHRVADYNTRFVKPVVVQPDTPAVLSLVGKVGVAPDENGDYRIDIVVSGPQGPILRPFRAVISACG